LLYGSSPGHSLRFSTGRIISDSGPVIVALAPDEEGDEPLRACLENASFNFNVIVQGTRLL
jgi:hypothetical protein